MLQLVHNLLDIHTAFIFLKFWCHLGPIFTWYMIISQNLNNSKLISLYDNVRLIYECFITYNMPSGAKKQKYQTRKSPDGQNVFFLLLVLLLQMASSILHDFHDGFLPKTAALYTEQCTSPLVSFQRDSQLAINSITMWIITHCSNH